MCLVILLINSITKHINILNVLQLVVVCVIYHYMFLM